jgi:hypothetical protein
MSTIVIVILIYQGDKPVIVILIYKGDKPIDLITCSQSIQSTVVRLVLTSNAMRALIEKLIGAQRIIKLGDLN